MQHPAAGACNGMGLIHPCNATPSLWSLQWQEADTLTHSLILPAIRGHALFSFVLVHHKRKKQMV